MRRTRRPPELMAASWSSRASRDVSQRAPDRGDPVRVELTAGVHLGHAASRDNLPDVVAAHVAAGHDRESISRTLDEPRKTVEAFERGGRAATGQQSPNAALRN